MRHILPLGITGRTVELRGDGGRTTVANLVCFSELTQHQLSVAVLASGAGKEAFYAGLFHDVYKSAMDWRLRHHKWSWYHLVDETRFRDVLMPLSDIVDVKRAAHLCSRHHSRDTVNPIREVERCAVEPIERRLPPLEQLGGIAHEVVSLNIRSPYRAFVASLLIEKLLNRLNESYARFFDQEFGLKELHVKYVFKQYRPLSENPQVDYDNGILRIEIPVRTSPPFEELVVEHHYLPALKRPDLLVREKHVELTLRFSDALVFPIIGDEDIMLWAITPAERIDSTQALRTKLAAAFEEAKRKALDDLLDTADISPNLVDELKDKLPDELSQYKPPGAGKPKCMFCGSTASFRVARSLDRFVDVDRIVAFSIMACAPCKLAYDIENARRTRIPLCVTPLPATPINAEVLNTFKIDVVPGFSIPTHPIPPIKTALEEPWARIVSWAFYNAILEELDELGLRKLRNPRELNIPLFSFFLSREILLYPFVFKIRPAAMISGWTMTGKKKFVLNLDTASDFVVLPGAERDLTLEDLDVLAVLKDSGPDSLRKAYRTMRRIYGLG